MHRLSSSFVLAYHGCDAVIAEKLLSGAPFKKSQNEYDWLGHGVYFWEANPQRGVEFASTLRGAEARKSPKPTVVGAVIDLGLCLDLTTSSSNTPLVIAHQKLKSIHEKANRPLPRNSPDMMRRNLDCAVIQTLHKIRDDDDEMPIDSVKGAFIEGDPIYPDSAFRTQTHIQICVCNLDCIKGVFRVRC